MSSVIGPLDRRNSVGVKIEYNFLLRIFHKNLLKILSCGYPEILKMNFVSNLLNKSKNNGNSTSQLNLSTRLIEE